MKLAEALSRRSALMEKSQQLRSRLKDCIKVQEGDEPTEDADQVIEELDQTLDELQNLIYSINLTNTNAVIDGRNLTSLLAERDVLSMRTKTLYEGLKHLTEQEARYGRMEIIIRKSKNPAKPKRKVQNPAKIGENHNSKRLLKYKSRNIGMIKKSIGSQANPMLFFAY